MLMNFKFLLVDKKGNEALFIHLVNLNKTEFVFTGDF